MTLCHLDFETRSGADLKDFGAHLHVTHEWAAVWCIGYAFDEEPVTVIPPTEAGLFLYRVLEEEPLFAAHNAQFEWQVWNHILTRYGFPKLPIERFRCTMAAGYAMALPGSLDDMSAALGIAEGKDMVGNRLAVQMAKPRAIENGVPAWWDTPEKRERLEAYCKQDVVLEREVYKRLRPLPEAEQRIWCLDAAINERGVFVDEPAAKTALAVVQRQQVEECAKVWHLTGGEVNGPSEVKRLTDWITAHGVDIPSLAKQDIIDTLATVDMPPLTREVIEIRQTFAKTSTAKVDRMLSNRGKDGRLRGLFQYHAANTGRWGGRRIQPHNLPRPTIEQAEIEAIITALSNSPSPEAAQQYISVFHGPPLARVADCLRGLLRAEPGKELYAGDFANIEGRVLAWLAGEGWKLEAFRAFDAGTGPDLYLVSASRIYHKPVESYNKKSPERQIGKVAELACFADTTRVLTDSGVKPILELTTEDKLWDGVEWVAHQGVVTKGVRQVVNVDGIEVTPDHLIKTGQIWKQAGELVSNQFALFQALETGSENLPLSATTQAQQVGGHRLYKCNVPAGLHPIACTYRIYDKEKVQGATLALKSSQPIGEKISGLMPTWYRQTITDDGSLIVLRPASTGARTPTIAGTTITGLEVLPYVGNGETAEERFLPTWSRCRGGMTPLLRWIESIRIKATLRGTYGLSLTRITNGIDGPSGTCRPESKNLKRVYDVVHAGPRNRFTVVSSTGALIVHNCGYQGGVGAFQSMAKNYGVKVPDNEADSIKVAWRNAHPAIKRYWYDLEAAAVQAIDNPGLTFQAGASYAQVRFRVVGSFLWCALPSGRALCYPYPHLEEYESEWGLKKEIRYKSVGLNYQWGVCSTYGGSLAENITQAVARDILAEAMLRLDVAGWPIMLHVHDEIVAESHTGNLAEYLAIMKQAPLWAAGLPIAVEGWTGVHYRK